MNFNDMYLHRLLPILLGKGIFDHELAITKRETLSIYEYIIYLNEAKLP